MENFKINTAILYFGDGLNSIAGSVVCSVADKGIYFESEEEALNELCKDIIAIYRDGLCEPYDCCKKNCNDKFCKYCGARIINQKIDINDLYGFINEMPGRPPIADEDEVCGDRDIVWDFCVSPTILFNVEQSAVIEVINCEEVVIQYLKSVENAKN